MKKSKSCYLKILSKHFKSSKIFFLTSRTLSDIDKFFYLSKSFISYMFYENIIYTKKNI